ncbi:hypothetical protein LTR39_002154 [Cryomyces antarcticus]|nr:hypothetical protein LTR39_002154 [Cryomyces antarcticus]
MDNPPHETLDCNSTNVSLQLSLATESDLHRFTVCQFDAFYNGPDHDFLEIIFPGPPTDENIVKVYKRQLALREQHGLSTMLKVEDTKIGAIVAGAQWSISSGVDDNARHLKHQLANVDWCGEEGSDRQKYAQWVMDEFLGRRIERMQGPHALLDLCFCHPSYQRRGAGTQLVRWGCRRADELGIPAFVEATATGTRLYEQNGFIVTEAVRLHDSERWGKDRTPVVYNFMWRPPKPQTAGPDI